MSESGSDYNSKNANTATTEAFTDPENDYFSGASSHGTTEDFVHRFMCMICLTSPTPDQAMQFALLWVAGESPAVLCAPNDVGQVEVFLCCQACQNFCHPACIDTLTEVILVVGALCAVLSGTVPQNKCKDCTNNANELDPSDLKCGAVLSGLLGCRVF